MFLGEPARKARESQVEGEQNAARSQGVGVGRERRARGQGNVTEERTARELCCHALLTPDKSAISKTRSIFQRPDAAFSSALHRNSNSTGAQDVLVLK